MQKYIYNEYDLAEQYYTCGLEVGNFTFWQVALLAKHLRNLGFGEVRIEQMLVAACELAYNDFNEYKKAKAIQNAVKQGMRFKLRKVGGMTITKGEVDKIMSIEGFVKRKFLLILLCYAKILKYTTAKRDIENEYPKMYGYYVANKYIWEIIQTAHISISKKKVTQEWLYEFYQRGLIDGIAGEMDSIKVLYANDTSEFAFEIDIKSKIDILDKCNRYLGDKITCESCGKEFVKRRNQKYCKDCAELRRKEKVRQNVKRFRGKETGT
jgi:hypothetical protein